MTMNARKGKRGGSHAPGSSMRPHAHGGGGGPRGGSGGSGERGERHHGHSSSSSMMMTTMLNDRPSMKDSFCVDGVYSNPRLMYATTSLIGCTVRVQLRSGKCYEGVLKCYSSKFEMMLEYAHEAADDGEDRRLSRERIVDKLIVQPHDVVTVSATSVDLDFALNKETSAAASSSVANASSTFVDSAIGAHNKLNGGDGRNFGDDHHPPPHHRDHHPPPPLRGGGGGGGFPALAPLQPWDAEEDDDICLEEGGEGDSSGWDPNEMFRANAERFGVESSYDSSLEQYTMPLLPKNSEEFKKREEVARKLAEEIESSTTYKDRIALENDEGGGDEEDKFSAVVRPETASTSSAPTSTTTSTTGASTTGKYIPPAKRDRASPAAAAVVQSSGGDRTGGGGGRGGARNSSDRHVANSPQHRDYNQHHHREHPHGGGYHGRPPYVGGGGGGGGTNGSGGRQSSPRAAAGNVEHGGGGASSTSSSSKGAGDEGGGGRMRRHYESNRGPPHPRKSSASYSDGKDSSSSANDGSYGQSPLNANGATASGAPSSDSSPSLSHHHHHHPPPPPPSKIHHQVPPLSHHQPQQLIPPISVITLQHPPTTTTTTTTSRVAPISYSAAVASPTGSAGGRSPVPPASTATSVNAPQPSPTEPKLSPQQSSSQFRAPSKTPKPYSAAASAAQATRPAATDQPPSSSSSSSGVAADPNLVNAQAKALGGGEVPPPPQPAPSLISQNIAPLDHQKKPSNSKKPREEQIAELKDFSKNFNLQEADGAQKGTEVETSASIETVQESNKEMVSSAGNRDTTRASSDVAEEKEAASAPGESEDAPSMPSKSKLNPNAKEFTFNPLAKSFVPRPGPGQSASSQQSNPTAQVAVSPTVAFPQSPVTPQGNGPMYPPHYVPPVVGNGAFPPAVPVSVAYQGVMTYSPTQNNFSNGNNNNNHPGGNHGANARFPKPPQPVPGVFQSPRNSTSDNNGQPNQEGSNGTMTVIPQGYPTHPMAFATGPGHGLTSSNTPGTFPPAGYPQVYQVMGGAQRMIAPAMVAQHAGSTYLLQHPGASGNGGPPNAHSGQSQAPGQAQAPTPVQQQQQQQQQQQPQHNNAQASSPPQEPTQPGSNGASMIPPAQVPGHQVGNQTALSFNPQMFYHQQQQMQQQIMAHHFHQAQQQAAQAQQSASGQAAAPTSQPQVVTPGTPGVALNAPVFSQSGQIMYQVPMMAAAYHHRFATAAAATTGNPAIQLQPGKQPQQPNAVGPQQPAGSQPASTPTGQPPQQPPTNMGQVPSQQQPGVPGFVQYAAPMGMTQGYQIQHPPPSHPGANAATQAQPHVSTAGYPPMYQHYAIASVPPSAAGAPSMSTPFAQTSGNNNQQPPASQ